MKSHHQSGRCNTKSKHKTDGRAAPLEMWKCFGQVDDGFSGDPANVHTLCICIVQPSLSISGNIEKAVRAACQSHLPSRDSGGCCPCC